MSNLQRLIASKFLLSLSFTVPIQTLFLFAKGLQFSEIMLLESVLLAGILLFQIPTGMFADMFGRKRSMLLGALVMLIAWIPWFLADGFPLFAVSFFLFGIAIAFHTGSDQALIYDELHEQHREGEMQKLMGRYLGSATLATAVGSLAGGLLSVSQNLEAFLFLYKLNVAMQIAGFLLLWTVHEPAKSTPVTPAVPVRIFRVFLGSVHLLLTHRKLRKIFLLSLFTIPFSFVLVYIFQPYFQLSGVPAIWYGIAVSVASLLSFLAKVFAFTIERRLGVSRGVFVVSALPGILWLAMAVTFHPAFAVVLYILNDTAGNVRDPLFSDYLNRHIEGHNRATVLSTIAFAGSLYAIIIRPIAGLLADIDLRFAFLAMGSLIVSGALLFKICEEDVAVS